MNSLDKILKEMNELKEWGVKKIYLYSATSTSHKYIKQILRNAEKIGVDLLIEPSRIDYNFDEEILSYISKYRDILVIPIDGASERIRKIIGSKPFSDSLILDIAKKAHDLYGIKTFSLYQIINFEGETEEDRNNIARIIEKIIKLGDNIKINLYINPVFPSPNTPYERFSMEDPEITMSRIQEIWEQVANYSDTSLKAFPAYDNEKRGDYFGGGSISFRVIPPVDQFIEGLTLRGDARSGITLYELYKKGFFDNYGNLDSLRKIKTFLGTFNYERYFREINLDQKLPWFLVRPKYLSNYLDKRYISICKKVGRF